MSNKILSKLEAIKIAGVYVLFGLLWILLSDAVVLFFTRDAETLTHIQSLKGWAFVLITAVLIFTMVDNRIKRLQESDVTLIEFKRKLSTILKNLPGMVYRCANDADYTMEYLSDGVTKLTGYLPEDIAHNRRVAYNDIIYPEDRQYVWDEIQKAIESHHPFRLRYRIVTAQGDIRWVWEQGVGIYDKKGRLTNLEGFITDVTDLRNTEEALRASEEKYRIIVEHQNDLVVKVDTEGRFLFVSPSYCKTFGKTEDELLNQTFMPLVHEDDRESTAEAMKSLYYPPHTIWVEQRAMTKDGWRWFSWVDTAVLDDDGNVVAIVGLGRDVTARKEMEERLRESEAYMKSFVKAMPDLALVLDEDGRYLEIIAEDSSLLYKDADKLRGHLLHDLFPKEEADHYLHLIRETMRTGGSHNVEYQMNLPTGPAWFEARTSLLELPSREKKEVIWVARDITKRKRMQEEKAAIEAQLRQQQKLESVGTLAGGIAHEINNPINIIMNYGELILDHLDDRKRVSESAREIIGESERIADIVSNLLAFSRQEQESSKPISLKKVIDQTVSLTNRLLLKDHIILRSEIPEELPLIKMRSQQIMQVLMNLITNARDALNTRYPDHHIDKNIYINADVVKDSDNGQEYLRVTIEDHGTGIPKEIHERIFDPFFTTKECNEGTGLGLSVSHGIVRDHNGRLLLESEINKYTRFHLDLPVNPPDNCN